MAKTPKDYYHENPKPYQEAQRRYRKANMEKIRAYKRELYQQQKNDPEFKAKFRERWVEWYKAHKPAEAAKSAKNYIRRKHGLSHDEAVALIERRKAGCQICGSKYRPAIDHCHTSGKIRGILCQNCNMVIGNAKDDPNLLEALAAYLRSTS